MKVEKIREILNSSLLSNESNQLIKVFRGGGRVKMTLTTTVLVLKYIYCIGSLKRTICIMYNAPPPPYIYVYKAEEKNTN